MLITAIKDGIQQDEAVSQLKDLFKNQDIQAIWSKRIGVDQYILVLEQELYDLVYLDLRKDSAIIKKITSISPPMGECSLSIEKVVTVTPNYFIVSNKNAGSGYCADFPIVFDLKNFKRLKNEPIEISELSFSEMSDRYFQSEVTYIEREKRLLAQIKRYALSSKTQDTLEVKEFEQVLYDPN